MPGASSGNCTIKFLYGPILKWDVILLPWELQRLRQFVLFASKPSRRGMYACQDIRASLLQNGGRAGGYLTLVSNCYLAQAPPFFLSSTPIAKLNEYEFVIHLHNAAHMIWNMVARCWGWGRRIQQKTRPSVWLQKLAVKWIFQKLCQQTPGIFVH